MSCWKPVQGEAMRVTALDSCGAPLAGVASVLSTDAFISVSLSPQYEDGAETTRKAANGKLLLQHRAIDELKEVTAEIQLIGVNPDLVGLLTRQEVLLDHAGDAIGNDYADSLPSNFALELWSNIAEAECVDASEQPYGYLLIPFLNGGRIGDLAVNGEAIDLTITSRTKKGSAWGIGPHNVQAADATGTAGKLLVPVGPKTHFRMFKTTIAPPAVACDPTALVLA